MLINLAKASLYLRMVGKSTANYFSVSDGGVSFEAGNFSKLDQGNPSLIFENNDQDFFGNGYMHVLGLTGVPTPTYPSLTYPIKVDNSGKYTVYARVKRLSDVSPTIDFNVYVGESLAESHSVAVSLNTWEWIQFDIVVPTTEAVDLKITFTSFFCLWNCFHISNEALPDSISFESPFITAHFKIYRLDNNLKPFMQFPIYDYKTTISELKEDDWYNFSLQQLPGNPVQNFDVSYAVSLFSSGSSPEHHIVWDFSEDSALVLDPYNPICSLIYNAETRTWDVICDKKYAIKMYSYEDSYVPSACEMVTPAAAVSVLKQNKFDTQLQSPSFVNTEIQYINSGQNKVKLALPNRIVSVLMDQSGSMTWNDSPGLRHTMTERLINRVESTYPGDVRWNIMSFEGTPIRLNFFAVVESDQINTNDVASAASAYFADQESGYAGVRLIRKKGSYPNTPVDGEIVTEGFFDRAYDDNLVENTEYFYKAYTFNQDGTYSDGVEIESSPKIHQIPTGIGQFSANILKGSGVRLDSNVVASWHFNEGIGFDAFDFTANQTHLSSLQPFWLNNEDVPSGSSGVRFGGVAGNAFLGRDSKNALSTLSKYTIMFWVYLFDNQGFGTILDIGDSSDSPNTKMSIGTNVNKVFFTTNYSNYVTSDDLPTNEWTHVAVTVDETNGQVSIYLNGQFNVSGTLSAFHAPDKPRIYVGDGVNASGELAFARVTEMSIHNVVRPAEYIASYSVSPDELSDKILDNGDRIIVLNYTIPDGANYLDGEVRVLKKIETGPALYSYTGEVESDGTPKRVFDGYGDPPYHPNDGEVISDVASLSSGQYFFTVHDDFVHKRKYDFKIFSKNTLGNFSHWSDSPLLSIEIPPFSQNSVSNAEAREEIIPLPSLTQVPSPTIQIGNRKNYIKWNASFSSNVSQVLVYYSSSTFPIFDENGDVSNAELVFSGMPSQNAFVHRNIPNFQKAYYAIVAADKYGYKSTPTYFSAIPDPDANEIGIPLLEVRKLRYEVVDEEALSLGWEQPVRFSKSINAYFDQRVALYAQITDEFGAPIADDSRIKFIAEGQLTSAGNAENVFGDTVDFNQDLPEAKDTFLLSSAPQGGGLIKGILRMTPDFDILSAINQLSVKINVFFSIPDRDSSDSNVFEYTSLPLTVTLNNPFKMELVNQSKDIVTHLCKDDVPLSDVEFMITGGLSFDPNREKDFDGTYIRRERPFVARVKAWYRDVPLPIGGNAYVSVKKASDPGCDQTGTSGKPFTPSFSSLNSTTVQPPATTIGLQNGNEVDSHGVQTAFSYADIPLTPPRFPEGVMLFAQVTHNGFTARKKMYVVFENILRVETTINEPATDCVEQAEQFASVYMIDPNNPVGRIRVPDNEICRWNLKKGITGKDRPFFSLDSVAAGPGVFSFIRNNSARKVFFGPACGVVWQMIDLGPNNGGPALLPEMYAVKATVVYDGLTAFEERPLVLFPAGGRTTFGSRFLMNFPDLINEIWADGYDYEKLTVYRDPNSAGGPFGSAFRTCAEELNGQLFIMNKGQIVDIETGADFEILSGDNLSLDFDADLDEYVFSDNQQDIALASIPLSSTSDETNAYLRINTFIGPKTDTPKSDDDDNDSPITNVCGSIAIPAGAREEDNDHVIVGHAGIILNGEQVRLDGGGTLKNGIPPTIVRLKEPLRIKVADARRNGEPTTRLLVDGQTEHTFVFEVSFSDKNVPNGTPVILTVEGENPTKVQLRSSVIYTFQTEDSFLDEGVKSYAYCTILPLNPSESFSAQIVAKVSYDKRGDVTNREMKACIGISYDASESPVEDEEIEHGSVNVVFTKDVWNYDIVNQIWTKIPSLTYARGGLRLESLTDADGNALYALGGLGSNSVTSYNERYDIDSQSWEDKTPMNVPRFYHMSCVYNNKIYVFGGYTIESGEIKITDRVEVYDPTLDAWTNLADMPTIDATPYGISMGACVVDGAYAYILSGIRDISSDGTVRGFNDRVLVYSFADNEWTYSSILTGSVLAAFSRMSAFVYKTDGTSSCSILGGAYISVINGVQSVRLCSDSYNVDLTDPVNPEVSLGDGSFYGSFVPRYKGGYATYGIYAYLLGGSNLSSNTLRKHERATFPLPSVMTDLSDSPFSAHSFGMTANTNFADDSLYLAGGMTSGRQKGFAQIKASLSPALIRLDGRQSSTLSIEIRDETGEKINSPVRVVVRGFLVFPNAGKAGTANRDALVYPVVFSTNDFIIENGLGGTVLLPRSDDILKKIDEIKQKLGIVDTVVGEGQQDDTFKISEGLVRTPYSISVQVSIVDEFYYGQTVIDVSDDASQATDTGSSTGGDTSTGGSSTPSPAAVGGGSKCVSFTASKIIPSTSSGSNPIPGEGVPIQSGLGGNSIVFNLNPAQMPQLSSPSAGYFCDIEWIPQVRSYIGSNRGTAQEALKIMSKIRNSIPFGGSPLYDGLNKIAETLLQNSGQNLGKIIYVNTDNEENLSISSPDEVIENIQSIDGFGRTPVIANNFSVVFPVTLSALVARTDTESLERLAVETGGQSQTILEASFIDEVLNNAVGKVNGSIGWGMYEVTIDLKAVSVINSIYLNYELYENTDGNWTVSVSDDGLTFGEESDQFGATDNVRFDSLSGRYLKFKITLLSGLSASVVEAYEGTASPGVPALTGINIEYSFPRESYIFVNPESPEFSAQQIAVAVRSKDNTDSSIEVGAATSLSSNWEDYQNGSQLATGKAGKIFIPIRTHQTDANLDEPLISIDGYLWKTKYGAWNPESRVSIKKADGSFFEESDFKSFARQGLIVFTEKQSGEMFIDIENSSTTRLGIRIVNKSSQNPAVIQGFGYFYNTNVFLPPPLAQRPPEARELALVPSVAGIYTPLSLSYKFFDINADLEDTEQTEIRWYINGLEIEYLRDLTSWNNISDTNDPIWTYGLSFKTEDIPSGMTAEQYARQRKESILKVDDVVFFTVKPSDGKFLGAATRSPSLKISASPPFVTNLQVKGIVGSVVQDTVTTSTSAFADYNFFDDSTADGSTSSSTIIWYVNGREFKRGPLGGETGGLKNNQVVPGELQSGTGTRAIAIGNDLEVEIRPAAGQSIGNPVRSSTKTVQNSIPVITSVVISPAQPTSATNLSVSYQFSDIDVTAGSTAQSDRSSIKWYRKRRGQSSFEEVTSAGNQNFVPSTLTASGDQWYSEITPFDGVSIGVNVRSNTVTIT